MMVDFPTTQPEIRGRLRNKAFEVSFPICAASSRAITTQTRAVRQSGERLGCSAVARPCHHSHFLKAVFPLVCLQLALALPWAATGGGSGLLPPSLSRWAKHTHTHTLTDKQKNSLNIWLLLLSLSQVFRASIQLLTLSSNFLTKHSTASPKKRKDLPAPLAPLAAQGWCGLDCFPISRPSGRWSNRVAFHSSLKI